MRRWRQADQRALLPRAMAAAPWRLRTVPQRAWRRPAYRPRGQAWLTTTVARQLRLPELWSQMTWLACLWLRCAQAGRPAPRLLQTVAVASVPASARKRLSQRGAIA